jgi:hypothetical protein
VIGEPSGERFDNLKFRMEILGWNFAAVSPRNYSEVWTLRQENEIEFDWMLSAKFSLTANHIRSWACAKSLDLEVIIVLENDAYPLHYDSWPHSLQYVANIVKKQTISFPFLLGILLYQEYHKGAWILLHPLYQGQSRKMQLLMH